MESATEATLVVLIDDVLSKHSGGGLIRRSELVDALLDLRITVSELAALASLDPPRTPEQPVHASRWHRSSHPTRSS